MVVSAPLKHTFSASGTAQRNATTSYFVTVPEGAKTLEVALSGLKATSQTRFIALHPYGVPADPTSTVNCYPNYSNPANTCRPDLRSYVNPQPGVWEIEVESRRTSPLLDNPYKLDDRRARRGLRAGDRDRAGGQGRYSGRRTPGR
ncbi:hypothetical protein SHIRM173S_12994 [Streptomyces hirsutus]